MRKSPKQRVPWSVFCLDSVLLKICLRNQCENRERSSACDRGPSGRERIGAATFESGAHFSDREESHLAASVTGEAARLGNGPQGLRVSLQGPFINPVQRPWRPKLGALVIRRGRKGAIQPRNSHHLNAGAGHRETLGHR